MGTATTKFGERKMKSLEKLVNKFNNDASTPCLRIGQYFCNRYIKGSWPELYYAEHEDAIKMIEQWLQDNHYQENLPQPIKR